MVVHFDRGDLWKSKARCLQLQLRDRFRVVVDRHCRRSRRSDGYVSSTVQRWLHRFRDFRRESLPPSSVFYRKRVPKDIYVEEDSAIVRKLQALAVPLLGNVCNVFMHGLNRVHVFGAEKLHEALLERPESQPLITVSNHVASLDDPLVIASLLPRSVIFDVRTRWTLCATDRCFRNHVTSAFFRCVKVLPVSRGDGIYQKGMDMAISKLNSGGWVHIFPEGTRSRDGGRSIGSAKRGVGRLVLDADTTPVVLPFVHSGMQDIMPIGAKVPRIGKTVTVLIGDPISFDDLLKLEQSEQVPRVNLYDAVSSRIGQRLQELKVQLDKLASEHGISCGKTVQQGEQDACGTGFSIEKSYLLSAQSIREQPEQNLFTSREPAQERYLDSQEGGIVSRRRGYMDQNELVGFAARGLFMNLGTENPKNSHRLNEVGPLKAWKQFWEANALQQWAPC